jgi:hypothetical protein
MGGGDYHGSTASDIWSPSQKGLTVDNTIPNIAGGGMVVFVCLFELVLFALGIAGMIFWIFQIIDVAKRQFPDPNSKTVWLLIVILLGVIGALVYHFVGKQQGTLPS